MVMHDGGGGGVGRNRMREFKDRETPGRTHNAHQSKRFVSFSNHETKATMVLT